MENQITENSPVVKSIDEQMIQTEQPKKSSFLVVLLSILLFISLAIAGFFAYQTQKLFMELQEIKNQELVNITPVPTSVAIDDLTSDWAMFTSNVSKYSIKFPRDWDIDTTKADLPKNETNSQELVIFKDQYKLTILWPAAYGPGICIFDDQSREKAPEMASYCEGKYIETKSMNDLITYRRLEKPEMFENYNQWEVYTFDKTYFVTVPIIRYKAPVNFDPEVISVMDQILSTYTPTN